MGTKIYVLVAYAKDGRIIDLGYSESLEMTRNEIKSIETLEQLKELGTLMNVNSRSEITTIQQTITDYITMSS